MEVSEKYGIEVNRNKKALCIFHSDEHPSMSFKNNRFCCFSCEAKGSAIDLVMKLFNLEPLAAVKKINEDFSLMLDLKADYIADMGLIREREENKAILKAFERWIDEMYSIYSKLAQFYFENMEKYKPISSDEEFHSLYVEAVQRWQPVNYILDVLFEGSDQEKIDLYKDLTQAKGGDVKNE